MTSCSTFGDNGLDSDNAGLVWSYSTNGGFSGSTQCWPGSGWVTDPNVFYPAFGNTGKWATVTPPSIQIFAWVTSDPSGSPTYDHGVLIDPYMSSDGYNVSFFYNGGTTTMYPGPNCCGSGANQMAYAESNTSTNAGFGGFLSQPSRWFGWQVICRASPCYGNPPNTVVSVHGVTLYALDSQAPTVTPIAASNVMNESGRWIRGGNWSASFTASDDSGVCVIKEMIGGQTSQAYVDSAPNPHSWTQCWSSYTINQTLDTTQHPNGTLPVTYFASDAAVPANVASPTADLQIDNTPVGLSMNGPSDAAATAGPQYITATATAGPSGVSAISCSVDGSPYTRHAGAVVRLPVSGLGAHRATCIAYNNAIDSNGQVAASAPATFTMSIREPMVLGAWAPTTQNPLSCHTAIVRTHTPGRWVTIHVHGRPVWVYRHGHIVKRRKFVCRLRTVVRKTTVWTTVIRNGHKVRVRRVRYVRVVLPPHNVNSTAVQQAFGRWMQLQGWLGTNGSTSAGVLPVEILAAPEDGSGAFRLAASTLTNPDGSWAVSLPPGPSRIVEAAFPGSAVLEPASSNQMTVTVPAAISLGIHPRTSHWGGKIRITGRLLGGYIPPSGELVLLRIGWAGGSTEIGHVITDASGRFHATYTFLRGNGTEHYWIWAESARESDYPFAPSSSQRVPITVTQK